MSLRAGPEFIVWSNLGHWYWKLPSQRDNAGQLVWRTGFFLSLASNWLFGFSQPSFPSTSASSCVTWAQKHSILQHLRAQRGQHTAACQGPRCGTWEPGSFAIRTEHECLVPTGPMMKEWTRPVTLTTVPFPQPTHAHAMFAISRKSAGGSGAASYTIPRCLSYVADEGAQSLVHSGRVVYH